MSDERLHLRVGAVLLVGLAAAVGLLIGLGGRHIVPGFRVKVQMSQVGPIAEGTPVRLAGRAIGEVQSIHMNREGVLLELWVRRAWRKHLHQNSEFFINQASVFGEAYLEVAPPRQGDPGPALEDGQVVRGVDPPRLDRLLLKSYQNLEAVTALLREGIPEGRELGAAIGELERTLDAIEPDPGAYGRTWSAGAQLFAEGASLLEALERSGTSWADVKRTAARARQLFERSRAELARVGGSLDRLAADVERLRGRVTPERLARFEQAIARTRGLIAEVDHLVAEAQAVAALVEHGDGTIGAFLHDEEIADDMKQLMKLMKTRPWVTVGHPQ